MLKEHIHPRRLLNLSVPTSKTIRIPTGVNTSPTHSPTKMLCGYV
jgi:hypothetical protein